MLLGATSQNHKTANDAILDLLSIESLPTDISAPTTADILSLGQETKGQVPSSAAAPFMDLLNGLAPSPPVPGRSPINIQELSGS